MRWSVLFCSPRAQCRAEQRWLDRELSETRLLGDAGHPLQVFVLLSAPLFERDVYAYRTVQYDEYIFFLQQGLLNDRAGERGRVKRGVRLVE
jgi:hypothetical protein